MTKEEKDVKVWKEGYDCGVKNILQKNSKALAIGNAILDVLDKRYQKHEEDY